MGIFDQLGGMLGTSPGSAGGANGVKGSASAILFLNALMPSILQAFSGAQASGTSLEDFFGGFTTDKKGSKNNPFSVKLGKGQFLDVSKLSSALPGLLEKAQTSQIEAFNKSAEKLGQSPAFAGIWNDASGNFSPDFTADVNKAYESLGNASLGAGTQSGFLLDPNKQASILGPLALQKAEFLKQVQKSAEAQKLGLLGAGGLAGGNPSLLLGANPQSSYTPGIFNGASLFQNNSQFNANLGFQSGYANAQSAQDLFGSLLAAGTFAKFG